MMRALVLGPTVALSLSLCALHARAEQFIVTDVSYTHSGATTSDSHYRVDPLASAPKNWKSPVDYSAGSAHVLLEVKTKPGATPTKFQICFEGTPSYACTDQSPTYTTTGTYQWTTPFSNFYFGGDVDWSKGVSKVALILKDTENGKPQGDPKYVPTDLHVEVAIISAGSSFVAPPRDAGVSTDAGADAGGSRADAGGTGAPRPANDAGTSADGGAAARDAGSSNDAGSSALDASADDDAGSQSSSDAGTSPGSSKDAASDDGDDEEPDDDGKDDGCSVAQGGQGSAGALWLLFGTCLGLAAARRRKR